MRTRVIGVTGEVGAPPAVGSDVDAVRADEVLLDGQPLRDDLGLKPGYPRLMHAIAPGM